MPLRARRDAMLGLETGREMAGIGKAAGDRDLGDGKGRVAQKLARRFETDGAIVVGEALGQMAAERAAEVARRKSEMTRPSLAPQGFAEIVLHELEGGHQFAPVDAEALAQGGALRPARGVDIGVQKPVAGLVGKRRAMPLG